MYLCKREALSYNRPKRHIHNPVDAGQCLRQNSINPVRYHDNRQPILREMAVDQLMDELFGPGIQGSCRLVQKNDWFRVGSRKLLKFKDAASNR